MSGLRHLGLLVRLLVEDRQRLVLENVALRHQLAVLKRSVTRPKIQDSDRMFWILMRRMLTEWRDALHFVTPDTVVRWHRKGFRYADGGCWRNLLLRDFLLGTPAAPP